MHFISYSMILKRWDMLYYEIALLKKITKGVIVACYIKISDNFSQ